MGYSLIPEFSMQVYLTDQGLDALYNGGLKDKIKYFTLESDAGQYGKFDKLEYVYDGTKIGGYQTSASTMQTITSQKVPQMAGRVVSNSGVTSDRIMRTNVRNLTDVIPYYPDQQTSNAFELLSYKYNTGKKYFNIRNTGSPKFPIVLGTRNITNLTHESESAGRYGYTSKSEPTLNWISTSSTPPFVGVSVTEQQFSKTEYQKFYIFNKSNQPLYIDSFGIKTIKPQTHFVTYLQDEATVIGNESKQTKVYGIAWDALDGEEYTDGELRVRTDKGIFNGSKGLLYPFEVLEIEVQYNVVNAGSNKEHYRGQTVSSPDMLESTIEFVLEMVTFKTKDKLAADKLATSASVIVPVKDSGFDASSFND